MQPSLLVIVAFSLRAVPLEASRSVAEQVAKEEHSQYNTEFFNVNQRAKAAKEMHQQLNIGAEHGKAGTLVSEVSTGSQLNTSSFNATPVRSVSTIQVAQYSFKSVSEPTDTNAQPEHVVGSFSQTGTGNAQPSEGDGGEGDNKEGNKKEGKKDATDTKPPEENANPCPDGHVADAKGDCFAKCPENTRSSSPDPFGNCECKADFICYDHSTVHEIERVSKELKPENAEKVMQIVKKDQESHPPGCSAHRDVAETGVSASDVSTQVSTTFFGHTCASCKCEARTKSGAHAASLLMTTLMSALYVLLGSSLYITSRKSIE